MTLLDRIDPDNPNKTISSHQLVDALALYAYNFGTKTQMKNIMGFDETDDAQIDEFKTLIDAKILDIEKETFISNIERLARLWESGYITKTQFKNFVGLA